MLSFATLSLSTSVFLSRTLLASCDRDVVEFMHQLDVLITAKQTQWDRKEVALRDLLQTRERDLSGLRLALQEREKEVCVCDRDGGGGREGGRDRVGL